jgi:hypothetical protein
MIDRNTRIMKTSTAPCGLPLWTLGLASMVLCGSWHAADAAIISISNEATWTSSFTSVDVADFEFPGTVTTQYAAQGATFSGSPNTPATTTLFFHNGSRAMYVSGAGEDGATTSWQVAFSAPVSGFSLWSFDLQPVLGEVNIEFYDATDMLLQTFDMDATGAGHGPTMWGFNGFVSDSANISRAVVTPTAMTPADAIWFDEVAWAEPIPEPSCALLLLLGAFGVAVRRRR